MAPALEWLWEKLTPGAIGIFSILGIVIRGYFKFKPIAIDLANKRETNLLNERAEDMATLRERIDKLEARGEQRDKEHAAEISLVRHKLNNAIQLVNYIFDSFEATPDRMPEIMKRAREKREQHEKTEAIESATLRGIQAAGSQL